MYRQLPRPRLENVLRGPSGDAVTIFTDPLARVWASGPRHGHVPGDVSQKGPSSRVKLAKHPQPPYFAKIVKVRPVGFISACRERGPATARRSPAPALGPVWVSYE